MKKTALNESHVAAGAQLVDFGGWEMPLHYGSQIEEHHQVRRFAGMFDVSHMTIVDVAGPDSQAWLAHLLANNVGRLAPGKGLYSCMLNSAGGVVDDLIVYFLGDDRYRVVVNAATRAADLEWMATTTDGFDVRIEERNELAMLAVQGPQACAIAAPWIPAGLGEAALALAPFAAVIEDNVFVARTGYTGEDGWEIVLAETAAIALWDEFCATGIKPCGLGARDTLRLEAGLNLYGQDMTTSTTPLESNLAWTIAWEPEAREFIGRAALEDQRAAGPAHKLIGLVLEGRGIMRAGQTVQTSAGPGVITSGGFSPTLEKSIALARVPADADDRCKIEIRKNVVDARVVRPPFVKNGASKI
jgi:aminomethyltransferase